jgi:hypothetical protein
MFIDLTNELANAQPEHTVEGGEYLLKVSFVKTADDAGYVIVRATLSDDPFAKDVVRLFNLPGNGRDEKDENRIANDWKEFFAACQFNGARAFDPADDYPAGLVGAKFWAILSDPTDDGKGYGEQNRITKFLVRR